LEAISRQKLAEFSQKLHEKQGLALSRLQRQTKHVVFLKDAHPSR